MVDSLQGCDAQAFIDVIDEVRDRARYSEEVVDSQQIRSSTFCSLGVG